MMIISHSKLKQLLKIAYEAGVNDQIYDFDMTEFGKPGIDERMCERERIGLSNVYIKAVDSL